MKRNEMFYYITNFRSSEEDDNAEKYKGVWGRIQRLFKKIRYRMKLKEMDIVWMMMGGCCFGLFPPSFYETHSVSLIFFTYSLLWIRSLIWIWLPTAEFDANWASFLQQI